MRVPGVESKGHGTRVQSREGIKHPHNSPYANPRNELLCDNHASQSGQQLLADTIVSVCMAANAGGGK